MAKISNSISFKSAVISTEDMTITEILKDDINVHDIMSILKRWDGIEGVSITIKKDDEVCVIRHNNTSTGEDE